MYVSSLFLFFIFLVYIDIFVFIQYIFFTLLLFAIYFFRNPQRVVADDSIGSVLSPIDGKIESIDRIDNSKVIIRIKNSICNTHIIRSPISSKVKNISVRYGMAISKNPTKSKNLNTKCSIELDNIAMNIITDFFPQDIKCDIDKNHKLKHGEKIGFLYSGTIEIELPKNINLYVCVGDKVKSCENLIGVIQE